MKKLAVFLICTFAGMIVFHFVQSPARSFAQSPAATLAIGINWGDQGDGTYKNPILKADYSDPDVIRVGSDFYLIASDFHFVGMQILHSKDLVNWKVIGQIFSRLTMDPKYDEMRAYSQGTWAPSIRFHNGEFYIYVCTPRDGLYMWHAKDPAGPWSDTVTVKTVMNWEDPCPFWDDDGQAYLVHSRMGAGPLILHKMSADGTTLLDDGKQIYMGQVSEGPKFYKRHGYYYISLPEGGVENGWQTIIRSKDIYGPYERKVVLEPGSPHQGGLVELDSGEAWFIGFKSVGWLGRICNLEPVTWGNDDWPTLGNNGKHVLQAKMPNVGSAAANSKPALPNVNDEFTQAALDPIWQWNHNPANENWSLSQVPGQLRLTAMPADSISLARNTLTQKLWDDYGVIDVKLSTAHLADGQQAGITLFSGNQFGWIGVEQKNGIRHLTASMGPPANRGGFGRGSRAGGTTRPGIAAIPATLPAPIPTFNGPEVADEIHLRAIYEKNGSGRFQFSLNGKNFTAVPGNVTLRFLSWKGSRIGLFSFGPNPGSADFDYFHYQYFSTPEAFAGKIGG